MKPEDIFKKVRNSEDSRYSGTKRRDEFKRSIWAFNVFGISLGCLTNIVLIILLVIVLYFLLYCVSH